MFMGRQATGLKRYPDLQAAANAFVLHWQNGDFGCTLLDDDELQLFSFS